MKSYNCDNCGAKILINDETSFSRCIYCGSTMTLIKNEYKNLNIKKIIMFNNTEEDAINFLTNNLGYASKDSIVNVQKLYIPVRFCSYDFNYLCSYQSEEGSADNPQLIDKTGLIDGMVQNEAILETNITNNILGFHDLRDNVRYDFDPIKLGNVSCEFSNNYNEEKTIKLIEKRIINFGKSIFNKTNKNVTKIYNINHYLTNTKIDDYTTLVPVFFIKSNNEKSYIVSGVINKNVEDKKPLHNSLLLTGIIMTFFGSIFFPTMFIGIIILIVSSITQKNNNDSKAQSGYQLSDNIRYSLYIENTTNKSFEFHNFNKNES